MDPIRWVQQGLQDMFLERAASNFCTDILWVLNILNYVELDLHQLQVLTTMFLIMCLITCLCFFFSMKFDKDVTKQCKRGSRNRVVILEGESIS